MQSNLLPVDVISLNSADGSIRPLRVRAEEGMEYAMVGNVSEILATREIRQLGAENYTFLCRIRMPNATAVWELKFFKRTHSWFMAKPSY